MISLRIPWAREHRRIRYDDVFRVLTLPGSPRETALVYRNHGIQFHYLLYWNEEELRRLRLRAVLLDEAQHLNTSGDGKQPKDQLNWIKSMAIETGVLHVLIGTYDLLPFCNLDGQMARRGSEFHFARYHMEDENDCQAFRNAFSSLLKQIPLRLESKVQEVQCSTCGSVSKAKLKEQSIVISPHPPRKSRPVRNVTRWMEQESDWVLVQKKE